MGESFQLSDLSADFYPSIVVLDDPGIDVRYRFLMSRLVREMAQIAQPHGSIEIYKIEASDGVPPTPFMVSSGNVDDAALEQLFDELTPLMQRVAQTGSLGEMA
ncbi:hypothetical protein DU002_14605 [Corallincola holothuriorum]|uniref:Uncharacterized protein n=1 Tax=Corallincola holothuriorum TaxID=2282215 RepID=A0A368N592_9GAMM|nr:hypothetical protein [Corallincola holothuriorum]RCU45688.1 hypothetical protein DU002_14605 [Corallincola holothuriorum]